MERFIFVTDIHLGVNRGNRKGAHAPRLLIKVHRTAETEKIDHLSDGGDRIIYTDAQADRASLRSISRTFNRFSMPHYHVNGNHDENLPPDEIGQILGTPGGSYSVDIKGSHNIYFSPRLEIDYGKALLFSQDSLDWLKRDLAANSLPAKLFVHVPVDLLPDDGRPEIEKFIPSFCHNAAAVRKLLEDDGKTEFVFSGHRHHNRIRHIWNNAAHADGIAYITHQSLVQRIPDTEEPYGAYTLFEVDAQELRARGFGIDQPSYALPRRLSR